MKKGQKIKAVYPSPCLHWVGLKQGLGRWSQHTAQLKTRFNAGCFALITLNCGFLLRAPGVVFSSNTDLLLRHAGSPCPERYKAGGKDGAAG